MITLEVFATEVGPRKDLSWKYCIRLGNRSPIGLTSFNPKGYATERGAKKAGERAIERFKKELD